MEKSIENIWKEGFTENKNLNIPELVNFYDKKSTHLTARIKETMYSNHKTYQASFFTIPFVYIILGMIVTAFIIILLHSIFYFIGKKQLESVEQIDYGINSYEYLKNFNRWWENMVSKNSKRLLRFVPLFLLFTVLSEMLNLSIINPVRFQQIINDSVAIYIGIGFITFIILVWIVSIPFYKKSLNHTYGKEINKLKELINDMEELRQNE